jgi:hypothetical protein
MKIVSARVLAVLIVLASAAPAAAQTQSDDWKVAVYPVFAWIPIGINIETNVPPISGGGGTGPDFGGKIVDGRFDGAFLGGVSANKGLRIDADGLWAAVGGDREGARSSTLMSTCTTPRSVGYKITRTCMPRPGCAAWPSLRHQIGRARFGAPGVWIGCRCRLAPRGGNAGSPPRSKAAAGAADSDTCAAISTGSRRRTSNHRRLQRPLFSLSKT